MYHNKTLQNPLGATLAALALMAGSATVAHAQTLSNLEYPDPGTVNPTTYTFTAAATGDIDAYFVSRGGADYTEVLGMLDNGTPTGITGLNNHTSSAGQELDLGSVHAGDTLTFFIDVTSPNLGDVYSNPALNATYDSTYHPSAGVNHIYSTSYNGTGLGNSIPAGTYVGFEDLPASNPPDYNYTDEQYVFTDVATQTSTVPDSASSLGLLSMSIAGIGLLRRRLCS